MCNGAGGLECVSMIRQVQQVIALQHEHKGMLQHFRALEISFLGCNCICNHLFPAEELSGQAYLQAQVSKDEHL